jgi:hypothetical protein
MLRIAFGLLATSIGCLAGTAVRAPDGGPATPVKPPAADYGNAFEFFYRLGLPAVPPDATPVELSVYREYAYDSHSSWLDQIELGNRAWLLPGDGPRRRFVSLRGQLMEVYDAEQAARDNPATARGRQYGIDPMLDASGVTVRWKPANEAADIKKLTESLLGGGADAEGESRSRDLAQSFTRGYVSAGPVLLAAAQYYRRGFTNEANTIIGALFTLAQDRRKAVVQAMSSLAEAQYGMAIEAFAASGA